MTKPFLLLALLFLGSGYAAYFTVGESIRAEYASGMFDAFISQSYGKSTVAFYQFDVAREKAKKAGENPIRINAIENLFIWCRMYASSLGLYYRYPTGNDTIIGEYRPTSPQNPYRTTTYRWGSSPEKERLLREFMIGIGEIISGVFLVTVSAPVLGTIGGVGGITIFCDGSLRIFSSLNSLWAFHQTELNALKEWEQRSLKPAIDQ